MVHGVCTCTCMYVHHCTCNTVHGIVCITVEFVHQYSHVQPLTCMCVILTSVCCGPVHQLWAGEVGSSEWPRHAAATWVRVCGYVLNQGRDTFALE